MNPAAKGKIWQTVVLLATVLALAVALPAAASIPPLETAPALDALAAQAVAEPPAPAAAGERFRLYAPGEDPLAGAGPARFHLFAETKTRVRGINLDLAPRVELLPPQLPHPTRLTLFGGGKLRRWNQNRHYDPELGRFLQPDPLGYVDGPNVYQYSGNDPINFSDPMGLCKTCIQDVQEQEYARYLASLPEDERRRVMAEDLRRGRQDLSLTLSTAPGTGEVKDWQETATGVDLVTGEHLTPGERIATGVAGVIPIVSGGAVRRGVRWLADKLDPFADVDVGEALMEGAKDAWEALEPRFVLPRRTPRIHMGKQGKHIPGHNNYIEGRSVLRADPERLAKYAGTGESANRIGRGKPGFKERVDFGEVIGDFVEDGVATPTSKGIITYAADGSIHIIPVRP